MRHETRYEAPSGDAGMFIKIIGQHRLLGQQGRAPGEFIGPRGLAYLRDGNMVAADRENHRVQRVTRDGEVVWCVGSLGSGEGQFNYPFGVAVTAEGKIYVTDCYNHRIVELEARDGSWVRCFGRKGQGAGEFDYPTGIACGPGGAIVVAAATSCVRHLRSASATRRRIALTCRCQAAHRARAVATA